MDVTQNIQGKSEAKVGQTSENVPACEKLFLKRSGRPWQEKGDAHSIALTTFPSWGEQFLSVNRETLATVTLEAVLTPQCPARKLAMR